MPCLPVSFSSRDDDHEPEVSQEVATPPPLPPMNPIAICCANGLPLEHQKAFPLRPAKKRKIIKPREAYDATSAWKQLQATKFVKKL